MVNSTRNKQKESASGLKPAPARGSALGGTGFFACLSLRAATPPMHPTTSLQPAHLDGPCYGNNTSSATSSKCHGRKEKLTFF